MSIISEALKKAQNTRAEEFKPTLRDKSPGVAECTPSPKKKRNFGTLQTVLIILLLLSLTATFFIFELFSSKNLDQTSDLSLSQTEKSIEPLKISSSIAVEKPKNENIKETVKKSFSYQQNQINLLELNGIMYSPMFPQAIINGQLVKEGDFVENFKIDKISPDKVTVSSDTDSYDIKM